MDNRKITLCLTTWNRLELLFDSFAQVIGDERISEIVIVDDASDIEIYNAIQGTVAALNSLHDNKIKLFRNETNIDCYRNKKEAISKATNQWAILLDSDNKIDVSYLDRLYEIDIWMFVLAYMPTWAKPQFNYTAYDGVTFTRSNIAKYIDMPMVSTCLNCMNYFINVGEYLRVWQDNIDPHTADSLLQNYNWLLDGNAIRMVPNMHYQHLVHNGSHYKNNVHLTGNFYEELIQKIKQLK